MGADLPKVKTGHRSGLRSYLSTMKNLSDPYGLSCIARISWVPLPFALYCCTRYWRYSLRSYSESPYRIGSMVWTLVEDLGLSGRLEEEASKIVALPEGRRRSSENEFKVGWKNFGTVYCSFAVHQRLVATIELCSRGAGQHEDKPGTLGKRQSAKRECL